jgi:hypothetical protein
MCREVIAALVLVVLTIAFCGCGSNRYASHCMSDSITIQAVSMNEAKAAIDGSSCMLPVECEDETHFAKILLREDGASLLVIGVVAPSRAQCEMFHSQARYLESLVYRREFHDELILRVNGAKRRLHGLTSSTNDQESTFERGGGVAKLPDGRTWLYFAVKCGVVLRKSDTFHVFARELVNDNCFICD